LEVKTKRFPSAGGSVANKDESHCEQTRIGGGARWALSAQTAEREAGASELRKFCFSRNRLADASAKAPAADRMTMAATDKEA
jgi:hypothetical protein